MYKYNSTSGLPGRRRVTPRACGARRRSIHPLHRASRARDCCPTRGGPVPFLKIAPQASVRSRDWPVPKSYHRPAQAIARSPCRQCGGPRAVSEQHTLSKSAILHRFPNYYTLRVKIFRMLLSVHVYVSTYDPY